MSSNYKIKDQSARYFLTITVVDWIDVFSRECYRQIVVDSLKYCIREKGLTLHAYVIMTNHVHLIVSRSRGHLSDTLRDFKSFTAKRILAAIIKEPESRREWMLERFSRAVRDKSAVRYQFWYHHNHPKLLLRPNFIRQKCHYIHQNPVKAGFVARPSDWLYSSAANYEGELGLLEVELLEEMYFF